MEFMGYLRADGSAGVRNHVIVLPTIGCANEIAFQIAGQVPGSIPLLHNHACIRLGEDSVRAKTTLLGICKNPNIHSVLLVGLGCEPIQAGELSDALKSCGKDIRCAVLDEAGNYDRLVETGVRHLKELMAKAQKQSRVSCELSKLTIGIKCGGSGAVSAISSNPSVGKAADLLIQEGGTVIFTETAELIGAEKVFARRGITPEVSDKVLNTVQNMKDRIAGYGVDILGSEPTQGNIKNGLTTIEEKSLGAIVKGGTMPLMDVLTYGQKPESPGLYFMDGTTQASQLFLGMFAAGAQIQIFSFGGGIPSRIRALPSYPPGLSTLPTLKVLGSCDDEDEKTYFDIYAGDILKGKESVNQVGERLFELIQRVASGEKTFTESRTAYTEMLQVYADGLLM